MTGPSKAALEFTTRVWTEMFGVLSRSDADINKCVVLAIAYDATAAASRDAVAAERRACVAIARARGADSVADAIAARTT